MRTHSEQSKKLDATAAEMLACPVCHADLRVESEKLTCGGCGRRYPVVEGIPVLIEERAEIGPAN